MTKTITTTDSVFIAAAGLVVGRLLLTVSGSGTPPPRNRPGVCTVVSWVALFVHHYIFVLYALEVLGEVLAV
jgi:hypothetical protein